MASTSAALLAHDMHLSEGVEDDEHEKDTMGLVKKGSSSSSSANGGAGPSKMAQTMMVLRFVAMAAAANLLFGYETSVIGQLKLDAAADFHLSTTGSEVGFLSGSMPIGATVGVFFAGFLQDFLGRRRSLILSCIFYICAVAVTYTAAGFPQLAAGRVLTGVTIGVFSSTVPMYVAELSPSAVRGSLVTINQVCICTGILLGYASTKILSPHWQIEAIAGVPLAVILLFAFTFFAPYSPRWLMSKDREEEARAVLMRIRGGDEDVVQAELDGIRVAIGITRNSNPYKKLREPHVAWAIVIGVMAALMQQWCGVNAVNAYAQDIFMMAGATASAAATYAVYIGVAKLVFVIVALILMDRVGRKPLLLVGCVGMAFSLLGLGLTLQLAPSPMPPTTGYVAAACLVLFMAFFEISLGPVLWLLLSELYPVQVKGIAMSVGSTTCWFFTYVVTQTFLPMKNSMGVAGVFFFYAAVCVFCFFWIIVYVPETKGRTLEDIEELLREQMGKKGKKQQKKNASGEVEGA